MAEVTEQLAAARAEAADMKGIMADTARILDQKNAEVSSFHRRCCLLSTLLSSCCGSLTVPGCDSLQPIASAADHPASALTTVNLARHDCSNTDLTFYRLLAAGAQAWSLHVWWYPSAYYPIVGRFCRPHIVPKTDALLRHRFWPSARSCSRRSRPREPRRARRRRRQWRASGRRPTPGRCDSCHAFCTAIDELYLYLDAVRRIYSCLC